MAHQFSMFCGVEREV